MVVIFFILWAVLWFMGGFMGTGHSKYFKINKLTHNFAQEFSLD